MAFFQRDRPILKNQLPTAQGFKETWLWANFYILRDQMQALAPEALRKKLIEIAGNMMILNEQIQFTPNHKNPI